MLNGHSAYAKALRRPALQRQYLISDSVLRDDAMTDEFRRALTAPIHAAKRGARINSPRLSALVKNIDHNVNHFAENAITLALGSLALRGLEEARRPWRMLDSMLCARVPEKDAYTTDELYVLETQLESELNPLQVQYIMGDRSRAVKVAMLEKFERYRDVLEQIITKLRRDLYGPAK